MLWRRGPKARWLWGIVIPIAELGCDPSEQAEVTQPGPPFLIVAPAVEQPASPDDGTNIYVQARGGTYVGVTTYGGKHRYSALSGDAVESCAELPGTEPLYFLVKPDQDECLVEVRLYAECDPVEGGMALQLCNSHGSFVESAIVPIAGRKSTNSQLGDAETVGSDASRSGTAEAGAR